MKEAVASFDQQAKNYNARAGLSEELCQSIAKSIVAVTDLSSNDLIFELGCGTGQIGGQLDKLMCQYHGIDLSEGMLQEFRDNHSNINGVLAKSDGRDAWPVDDNTVKVIFASRALHWIHVDHIVQEANRVKENNQSYLLVGRIEGEKNSWEKQLRKRMHTLLRDKGLTPLDGQQHIKRLREALLVKGCEVVEPQTVSTWKTTRNLDRVIQDWRKKDGLAGTQPTKLVKDSILMDLQQWAEEHFDAPLPVYSERKYVIHGFKLTA